MRILEKRVKTWLNIRNVGNKWREWEEIWRTGEIFDLKRIGHEIIKELKRLKQERK